MNKTEAISFVYGLLIGFVVLLVYIIGEKYKKYENVEVEKKKVKALVFVEHIEREIENLTKEGDIDIGSLPKNSLKVMCKICGKTIDEIYAGEKWYKRSKVEKDMEG